MKERTLSALRHEIPDLIPLYDSLDDSHIMKVTHTTKCDPDTRVRCYKKLGFDAVPAKTRTFEKQLTSDKKGRLVLIDEWNRRYVYTERHIKFYSDGMMTYDEFRGFEWPNPSEVERYEEVKKTVELAGDDLAVIGVVSGVFEKAMLGWGLSRFLSMLLKQDSTALKHMEKMRNYWIEVGKIESEIGVDAIMITDDYAFKHQPFFSPRLFANTVLPLLREEVAAFRRQGLPIVHHSDGDISLLLPLLADSGIDGIHSLEPTAGMDIGKVKREYGDRLTLMGNIDSGLLLSSGSPREVRKVVKKTIAEAAPGGSYILSSSNSLHYGCKLQNIIAMISAARKFGRYPNLTARIQGR